jgi:hypothetical protein
MGHDHPPGEQGHFRPVRRINEESHFLTQVAHNPVARLMGDEMLNANRYRRAGKSPQIARSLDQV